MLKYSVRKLAWFLADRWLLGALGLGLGLRVAFVLAGARLYYGPGREHHNGDSLSFINSFLNLWRHGQYTLEPLIPDAAFGRLPGYPFFYGLHYLIFGEARAEVAVTVTQLLLDVAVIGLLYAVLQRGTARRGAARLVAWLYAAYPFAIAWVPIIGTETLNTFLTVLWLWLLLRQGRGRAHYLLLGALLAVVFYVRVFMGALLPITLLVLWLRPRPSHMPRWRPLLLVVLGFGALYLWWPLRNYVSYQRLVLIKPVSAGYANQREDMQAYLDWLHTWTIDNTTWMEATVHYRPVRYPRELFSGPAEERRAYALTALAARCGSSFHLRRLDTQEMRFVQPDRFRNCNAQIAAGFDSLRHSYIRRHPGRYLLVVPTANLVKGLFKSQLIHPAASPYRQLLIRTLFACRSGLLLLGLAGLWVGRRKPLFWPIAAYFAFIYLYVSFGFRSLEIRYLLQADVLLLLPAAWLASLVVKPRTGLPRHPSAAENA